MIYLDNHSTTRCDQRVVAAMLPWLSEHFGNPHSSHAGGVVAADAIALATDRIAGRLGVKAENVVYTSGATESNNLAIRGVCLHPRQKRRHIVTVATEHPAVLDVAHDIKRQGFTVTVVPVHPNGTEQAGSVDLDQLADAITDDTAIVSVMAANNEIGSLTPLAPIAELTHARGALLHSDATQAIGRLPLDVVASDVDLISASAHKFYGPKGAGFLIVGNGNRRVRLLPQIVGGGQQRGIRSGTLSPANIVGIDTAMQLCQDGGATERETIGKLRDQLWQILESGIDGLQINGPPLRSPHRLLGNLNVTLPGVEGETLMAAATDVAFSTGSACSNVDPAPSHVLMALGLDESAARRSVRFGIGRFNTDQDIQRSGEVLLAAFKRLIRLAR
ncbi:Cysteine desulfurase [Rubripirellula lacrimiformis]|uniref:cysteine desulfurase n=1 Tax=Rubripirellula lacrimiformis TaxID=1930273 RepID=A0A517N8C0_9BACT|nr:cysteine desulfurase family protein [Rubripirellula lacrimiformis]QDT03387.1 Cysteine desulfurase [Rubripirellula lacrimiformis]